MPRYLLAALFAAVALPSAASAQEPPELAKHTRWVTALAFQPGGTLLASVGGESLQFRPGDVKLWDPASGALAGSLEGASTNVWGVAWAPDGQTLVTCGYRGEIIVWSIAEKKPLQTLERKGWIRGVSFASNGGGCAFACEDGSVAIYDPATWQEKKVLAAHEGAATCVAFSPDGGRLATGGLDKKVKQWNWTTDEAPVVSEGSEDVVWSVAWAPAGDRLASSGADRQIRLWDAAGAASGVMSGHKDWVTSVAWSPDGAWLASGSYDRTIKLWQLSGGEPLTLPAGASSVWSVAFSPDSSLVAAGSHQEGVRLWTVATQEERFPKPAK